MAAQSNNPNQNPASEIPDPTAPAADTTLGSPKGGSETVDPTSAGPGRYGGDLGNQASVHAGAGTHAPAPAQPPAMSSHGGSSSLLADSAAGGDQAADNDGGDIGGITDASDPESAAQARDAAHHQGGTWGVGGGSGEVH